MLTVAMMAGGQDAAGSSPEWWYDGPPGAEDPSIGPFEIDLDLGVGYEMAGSSAAAGQATEEISPGVLLDQLINRIFVYRRIHDRLILDFDYDASRGGDSFFGDEDYYALDYLGGADELIRRAGLGNRIVTIPGDRFVDTVAPPGTSVAAVVDAQASVAGGVLSVRGIARLGSSELVSLNFVGSRRLFEITARDTEHVRRKHFFLPDPGVGGLEVYVTSETGGDLTVDGRSFKRLQSPDGYTFDRGRAWLHLSTAVSGRDLIVTYTSGGVRVGDPVLGQSAYINESGVRENFSATTYPEQFGDTAGIRYLYLNRDGGNSYWEHRGVYAFEELSQISGVDLVRIDLLLTGFLELNSNYAEVITEYIVDTDRGLVIFVPRDGVGFYPRPFPGLFPYTHPGSPGNPFDPANSVYGNLGGAEAGDSVNTVRFRFSGESVGFVIDDLFIQNSVTVSVAGRELEPSQYFVDDATGIVTIADGIVSPESSVTVRYRRAADLDVPQALLAAASVDWVRGGLAAHGMMALDAPFSEAVAPLLGDERPVQGTGSAELRFRHGEAGEAQLSAALWGAARIGDPNAHDVALIAGMDDGYVRSISLDADEWQIASDSTLLPVASTPVSLILRGDLVFEDFTDASLIGGGLRTLNWDNSRNLSFTYAEKAGPYNSADLMPDGGPHSLVIDYRFGSGEEGQYVTIVRSVAGGLDRHDTLEIGYRGDSVVGVPVRLYVEVLQTYSEDLDGDDLLDGEVSIDDPGFPITPVGGGPTVIGSDRTGEPNGLLDSEDLNGNGRLDLPGGAGESGRIVNGGSDVFVVEIAGGEEEWQTVRLDLRALIAGAPDVFEDAEAIRLTVTPSMMPATTSSGRILLNRLAFRSSGMVGDADGRLSLQTVPSASVPALLANPLSAVAGEVYDDLHGSVAFRDSEGITEQVLQVSLIPPLLSGERAAVSRMLGGRRDLTRYESIAFYLFVSDPALLPAELMLDFRFVSTPGDYLTIGINPGTLVPGWNEIAVGTGGELAVLVNGVPVGTLSSVGDNASLAGVTDIEFGLSAIGGDLNDPVTLWTDDWHVRGSRVAVGISAGASVKASFTGDLVTLGSLPVVSDPRIALEYEYDEPGIESTSAQTSHTARADGALRLAGVVPLSVSGRWSAAPLPIGSVILGETSSNLHATIGIDTRIERVPTLEHSFRYVNTNERRSVLSDLEYLEAEFGRSEASVRLSQELSPAPGWTQHLSGTRSVTGGTNSQSGAAMTDTITGTLAGGGPDPTSWSMTAAGNFSRSFVGSAADMLGSLRSAYTGLVTGLFLPAASTLTDAGLAAISQTSTFTLSPARDTAVGFTFEADESTAGRNFSDGGSVRDITAAGSASMELTVAIGREKRVRVIPSLSRSFSTSIGQAALGYSNWTALSSSAAPALALPFAYLTPFSSTGRVRERDAVTDLYDLLTLAGDSAAALSTEIGLEVRVESDRWYIPSVLAVGAEGRTQLQASTVSQERSVSTQLSRSVPIIRPERGAGSLVFSSSSSFRRDFLQDTEIFHGSLTVYYAYSSVTGRSWQVNQSTSWTRERQYIGAERLAIFPDDPVAEPAPSVLSDSDRLVNRSAFQYSWRADRAPSATPSTLARRLGVDGEAQLVINREQISVETSTTFANPNSLGTTILLPLRITLEHSSEVTQTENLSFRLLLVGQGGLEKHVTAGYTDLVPAFGVELRLGATIRY